MAKFHNHHIVPKHMGGSNDSSNLILLTVEDHALAHKELFESFGKIQDYTAYRLLAGIGDKHEEIARLGGKIQGQRNRDSGHMSRVGKMKNTERQKEASRKAMFEKMNNCFLDPEKQKTSCSLGGKKQGRANAESGHCAEISKATAQQRSLSMKGKIFVHNDDTSNLIFEYELDQYLNSGWMLGRRRKKK